jgi:serine/threonine protein kinase
MSSRGVFADESLFKHGLVLGDGRIELIREIGAGAQGKVWLVRELELPKRECAAKLVIFPEGERNSIIPEAIRTDFKNEILMLGRLEAVQNIVNIHYIVEGLIDIDDHKYFYLGIVLEYSEIGDLSQFIRAGKSHSLRNDQKIDIMLGIANGVAAAHVYEIYHSDLKPTNVLLFRDAGAYVPKLADFGVAVRAGDFSGRRGTTPYMAPEVVLDGASVSAQSDAYSLGVLLHEIVTDRLPHTVPPSDSVEDELREYRKLYNTRDLHIDPASLGEKFGTDLPRLIVRLLDKNPASRAKAATVAKYLKGYRALVDTTVSLEDGPLCKNVFCWNPEIHRLLKCRRALIFLHSSHPDSDVKWIKSKLNEAAIESYSLHRVLGAYDFVIDCWIEETGIGMDRLGKVISQYEMDNRANRPAIYYLETYEPIVPISTVFTVMSSDDLIRSITNIVSKLSADQQFSILAEHGIVLSKKKMYGDGAANTAGFLLVEAARDLDENEIDHYFLHIRQHALRFVDGLSGLAVHKVLRMHGGRAFIVEFVLHRFEEYGKFIFGLASYIDGKIFAQLKVDFSYKSLLGLDVVPHVFGDDGLICKLSAKEFTMSGGGL